jgi:hypothetical protein
VREVGGFRILSKLSAREFPCAVGNGEANVKKSKRRACVLSVFCFLAGVFAVSGCTSGPSTESGQRGEPPPKVRIELRNGNAGYDLGRDEQRGGHTLARHVGRTDDELRARLARERNISAASTWTDRATAEAAVGQGLEAERSRVDSWIRGGYPRPNLALHYNAGLVIGRSLRRGDSRTVDCSSAVIVLRADGPESFYVLTTYPEARE